MKTNSSAERLGVEYTCGDFGLHIPHDEVSATRVLVFAVVYAQSANGGAEGENRERDGDPCSKPCCCGP